MKLSSYRAARRAISLLAIAISTIGSPALSQDTTQQIQQQQPSQARVSSNGWNLQCNTVNEALKCAGLISLFSQPNNQRFMAISISQPDKSEEKQLRMQLPHGIFLPGGVALEVDGKRVKAMAINTCNPTGCFTSASIKKTVIDAMAKGQQLAVVLQALNRNNLRIQMTLTGFKSVMEKVQ